MGVNELRQTLEQLEKATIEVEKLSFAKSKTEEAKLLSFHSLKYEQAVKEQQKILEKCKTASKEVNEANVNALCDTLFENGDRTIIPHILEALRRIKILPIAKTVVQHLMETSWNPKIVPSDLREELTADVEEIKRCLQNECYRAAIILCGKILEVTLHRVYYDATGMDLLEKAPGTGLGNLLAKITEKGIQIDPGLPNQIHVINQLRVHSVHAKKEPFTPSKEQAHAIYLYTIDVVKKLLGKKSIIK